MLYQAITSENPKELFHQAQYRMSLSSVFVFHGGTSPTKSLGRYISLNQQNVGQSALTLIAIRYLCGNFGRRINDRVRFRLLLVAVIDSININAVEHVSRM